MEDTVKKYYFKNIIFIILLFAGALLLILLTVALTAIIFRPEFYINTSNYREVFYITQFLIAFIFISLSIIALREILNENINPKKKYDKIKLLRKLVYGLFALITLTASINSIYALVKGPEVATSNIICGLEREKRRSGNYDHYVRVQSGNQIDLVNITYQTYNKMLTKYNITVCVKTPLELVYEKRSKVLLEVRGLD